MAVCQTLGLRLGKNPDIGSIVGQANKIGNICLKSTIFKLKTGNFYTDFLIGLSCQVASFMPVRQKVHLVRWNHTFKERIAEITWFRGKSAGSRYFWVEIEKKKIFVLIQCLNTVKKNKKKKEKKDWPWSPWPVTHPSSNHAQRRLTFSSGPTREIVQLDIFSPFLAPNLRVTTADGA